MIFARFPREMTGTKVSSGQRSVLGETAGSYRILFVHEMRDRLLAEEQEEVGVVLPPEETGHLSFLGTDLSWRRR